MSTLRHMTDLNATATAEIRAELARRRMPQAELAAAIGMSQHTLSRRLQGHVPLTVPELAAIAEALGVSYLTLLNPGRRSSESEVS